MQRAELAIRASAAGAATAEVLELSVGAPLLELARDSFKAEDCFSGHALVLIRPERYEFSLSSTSRVKLGSVGALNVAAGRHSAGGPASASQMIGG